jgi:hypothetical protein
VDDRLQLEDTPEALRRLDKLVEEVARRRARGLAAVPKPTPLRIWPERRRREAPYSGTDRRHAA